MTDDPREPNRDSTPSKDDRGSIEQIDNPSPDARNGAVGGTDGVTKNQDDTAQ